MQMNNSQKWLIAICLAVNVCVIICVVCELLVGTPVINPIAEKAFVLLLMVILSVFEICFYFSCNEYEHLKELYNRIDESLYKSERKIEWLMALNENLQLTIRKLNGDGKK